MRNRRKEKRRGIIIGGLTLFLLFGCNNGLGELEKKNHFLSSVANLGKGFLDIFTSFGDMVTEALGIKADTKKEDIGKYFTAIETTMTSVKDKLKEEVAKNGNYEKVKTVVEQFITDTLDKIAVGAKEAAKGATGEDKIGGATAGVDAGPADFASVNSLVKGIKKIVEVVLDGKGNPAFTKTNTAEQQSIGKLLGQGSSADGTEQEAAAASASIGAVTGSDILQAIAQSGDATSGATIAAAKNAAEIAAAQKASATTFGAALQNKDAVIAGGIALRAMAKDGKFTAKRSEDKSAHAVNAAAASAVNKTLSTLIIAIRNTVDSGLKKVNEALAAVGQGDVSTETKTNESGSTN